MEHSHVLFDTDTPFRIDPISRNIIPESSSKVRLIQHDHNSERFSFTVPRYIEGHDLKDCNVVEVHYLNIESNTKKTKEGVYRIPTEDILLKDDDTETLICSWRISNNATRYAGTLNFLIRFSCVSDDSTIEYAWNTGIYSGITIASGIYNTEVVYEDYVDVLDDWKKSFDEHMETWDSELAASQITSITQTKVGTGDGGENVWTATFGDGRKSELKVKNGSRGSTGYIGSVETINGNPLRFFVGTQAEYEALSNADKQNLFAVITDATTHDDIMSAIGTLQEQARLIYHHFVTILIPFREETYYGKVKMFVEFAASKSERILPLSFNDFVFKVGVKQNRSVYISPSGTEENINTLEMSKDDNDRWIMTVTTASQTISEIFDVYQVSDDNYQITKIQGGRY